MIRVITITHQCGSDGSELAALIANKHRWDLLDRGLVDRVARVADLGETAERFDHQAARWCNVLKARGVNLDELCPRVEPRWFGEVDDDSIQPLSAQLIRAAADFGECVIAVPGAQCLLYGRQNVLNVLVYAPIQERLARVKDDHPECPDVHALLQQLDSQVTKYVLEHYESEWLGAGLCLYDLCINTSTGLDAAVARIDAELMFTQESCTATPEVFSPCHPLHRP
ncbi:MAG TPA: cytidylate kinase-like family protein [Candidatus Acidoferrum sp.]|jgi:cytidylate kinase